MTTEARAVTDNELLMGLEAQSRERWYEAWDRGMDVLTTFAHRDLVPGEGQFDGEHRITVEYMPSATWRYWYRRGAYTVQMLCEDRDAALHAIALHRPPEVAS